ncbi:hypothetical protein HYPSUDRAFT_207581 [Hypholoma sublateritium FD-334 SS-4]|uniref:Uncharacterized protein n=1 Tax=Hypholoma sublateritium (strain FD-334 SS-4) TaxID=945553 RepID=A0A0D2KMH8_HYPSF|nr:hypothetical protein HYPSUDRAFT_207581 [Hypholoma sublateritium FD-334 SS-4]
MNITGVRPARPGPRAPWSRYPSPGPLLDIRTVSPMTSTPVPADRSLPRCCTPMALSTCQMAAPAASAPSLALSPCILTHEHPGRSTRRILGTPIAAAAPIRASVGPLRSPVGLGLFSTWQTPSPATLALAPAL